MLGLDFSIMKPVFRIAPVYTIQNTSTELVFAIRSLYFQ